MVQTWSLQVVCETIRTKILKRKFVRDVGVLTVANVIVAALSFVQGIVVARWLGPELYGITVLVMSYPNRAGVGATCVFAEGTAASGERRPTDGGTVWLAGSA